MGDRRTKNNARFFFFPLSPRLPTRMDAWCHARLHAPSPVSPADAAAAVRAHAEDEVSEWGPGRRLAFSVCAPPRRPPRPPRPTARTHAVPSRTTNARTAHVSPPLFFSLSLAPSLPKCAPRWTRWRPPWTTWRAAQRKRTRKRREIREGVDFFVGFRSGEREKNTLHQPHCHPHTRRGMSRSLSLSLSLFDLNLTQ